MAGKKIFEVAMILSASDKATRTINEATANAKKKISSLSGMGDKAFAFGRTSGAIGLGIVAPLGMAINAAEESEIAFKRLDKTFKNMGETNSNAANDAADYASKLQMQIGVEDEEIQMVQSKIATFKKVSDESARMAGTFDRATAAAFDLAAGGFGEASANAVQLGKALQDPARGATALAKTGALNKSDIPLIKQIQATKGLGAAQEYVLKAVERQVKGQAANTATSAAKMKVTFSEVAETLGKSLLPQVQKAMSTVGNVVNKFNDWAQNNKKLLGTIVKVVGGLGLLSLIVSGASFIFGGLLKVIAGAIWLKKQYLFWTNLTAAAEKGSAMAKGILAIKTGFATAAQWLLNTSLYGCPIVWIIAGVLAVIAIVVLLVKNWDKVSAFFSKIWSKIKNIFSDAWVFIKNIFFNYSPYGLIIKHWDKISSFFSGLWVKIKQIFLAVPLIFIKLGSDIISGLWNGIKSKASALFDFVKGIGKSIANAFKTVLGIASPSKVFMDYGVNITEGAHKGIQKGQSKLTGASAGMAKSITPNSSGGKSGSGGGVTINFSPTISGGGSGSDISTEIKKLIPQLIREIESVMQRKQRLAY